MKNTERTEKQSRFVELRASGMTYDKIATELGISKGTCSNWAKKYAAEIEQAKSQPLQRANKKKPRVIDITDKLELRTDSGKLSVAHFKTPEFKERYERGELTPEEAEGVAIMEKTAKEIGEQLKQIKIEPIKLPKFDFSFNVPQGTFDAVENLFDSTLIEAVNEAVEAITKSFQQLLPNLQEQFDEYVESLPPEEQAEIRAAIEAGKQKQKKANKGKHRSGSNDIATATVSNYLFDKVYTAALSGTATNQLAAINTTVNKPDIDRITGNATYKRDSFSLSIENYQNTAREFKISTNKLISICTMLLADINHYREKDTTAIQPTVTFTISDYMKLLGMKPTKPNRDKARAKIKADLDTLLNTKISWTEKRKGKAAKNGDFLSIPIIGGKTGIYKGTVVVTFSKEMAEYLVQNAYIMQYPLSLLKIDERNANAYPLGIRLHLHSSIDNNIRRGTATIISVKKALEYCPDIPTYTALQARNDDRHWERYIKDALERALDQQPQIRWEYSNPKGEPLTDRQLSIADYNSFIGLYIHYELIDAPDQTERLTAKAERKTKRAKKKNANKKEESEPRSERG